MKFTTKTLMLGLLSVGILLGGCSKVENPTGTSISEFEGTYALEQAYFGNEAVEAEALTISFSNDGKGYTIYEGSVANFDWILQGQLLNLLLEDGPTEMHAEVFGNMLTLKWEGDIEHNKFLKKSKPRMKGKKEFLKDKFRDKRNLMVLEDREMMEKRKHHKKWDLKKWKEECEKKEHGKPGDRDRKDKKDHGSKKKGKYHMMQLLKIEG